MKTPAEAEADANTDVGGWVAWEGRTGEGLRG